MKPNKVILGTAQFGLDYGINNLNGKPSDFTVKQILDFAYDNNIRYLDTAEAYGDSQSRIGKYLENSINKFNIITKFSPSVNDLPEDMIQRVLNNLKILNTESLYCYMFHSFNDFCSYFESNREKIGYLKERNYIKKVGVSIYTNDELEKVLAYGNVDLIQLPFNLLDNDNLRGPLLKKARLMNIEVHSRSVFLQGLFFRDLNKLRGNLSPLKKYIEMLQLITLKHNISMGDLALNYACENNNIDKVLIGVENLNQLESNIQSLAHSFDKSIFSEIYQIKVKETSLLNPSNWEV